MGNTDFEGPRAWTDIRNLAFGIVRLQEFPVGNPSLNRQQIRPHPSHCGMFAKVLARIRFSQYMSKPSAFPPSWSPADGPSPAGEKPEMLARS